MGLPESENTTELEKIKEDQKKERKERRVGDTKNCKKCGEACDPYESPALCCSGGCDQNIHIKCLQKGSIPFSFVGDVFFELNCASCNSTDKELVVRDKMPWLNVLILTLYNLHEKSSGISKRGYFHWKFDISTFVEKNWDNLFKRSVKKKKNWIGTISGTLSHYSGIFFKSGFNELNGAGWWKLLDKHPPEVLIAKYNKMLIDKKKNVDTEVSHKLPDSPTASTSSLSIGEDSNFSRRLFKSQSSLIYSQEYVKPTETLSDLLFEEDELNDGHQVVDDMDIKDDLLLHNDNIVPSICDLMKDCQQYEGNNFDLAQLTDNNEGSCNTSSTSPNEDDSEVKSKVRRIKGETYDDDSNNSSVSIPEPPPSLFHQRERRPLPWLKPSAPREKLPLMTPQEEAHLLRELRETDIDNVPPAVRRLYRKLEVREVKRERGLPLLNIDDRSRYTSVPSKNRRWLDRFRGEDMGQLFEQRLRGHTEIVSVRSPYTGRLLKPFIRRETEFQPLWLKVMEELCAKVNKDNPQWKPLPKAPIDFCYIKPEHISAANCLCRRFFWPGIDVTHFLQHPDFTCVVLYKKLVIGVGMMTPNVAYNEAYISYFLVRPEWRKCNIGKFMLYHLIQTCWGQDITLHVSATNTAMILYQSFGFKVEEFVQDFYDKYMPANSRESRHALFLRLYR